MKEIIYYVVSVLSVFLYVTSVQRKEKGKVLFMQALSSSCYLIVYTIKGAWSGVSIEMLEALKNVAFLKIEKKNKKIPVFILIIFILSLITVSIIFYDGIFSLLPLIINIFLFTSTYFKNPRVIRWTVLFAGIMWGIYNISLGTYIILIGNVLEVISASISLIRNKESDKKIYSEMMKAKSNS